MPPSPVVPGTVLALPGESEATRTMMPRLDALLPTARQSGVPLHATPLNETPDTDIACPGSVLVIGATNELPPTATQVEDTRQATLMSSLAPLTGPPPWPSAPFLSGTSTLPLANPEPIAKQTLDERQDTLLS